MAQLFARDVKTIGKHIIALTAADKMPQHCKIDIDSQEFTDEFGKKFLYNRATMIFLVGYCKICM